jgi:hypothetical protein
MKPELFKRERDYKPEILTSVHENGHVLQLLLAGFVPDMVNCIPHDGQNGSVSGRHILIADMGQDFSQAWRFYIKMYYSGIIAAAYYCGAYLYCRASEDLKEVEKTKKLYGLSEGDLLDCWLEAHSDIQEHWELIMEMAGDLFEHKLLGSEYFEELLFTR